MANKEITISSKIGSTGLALRRAIYKAHRGLCFYTHQPMTFNEMVVDHILPKTQGGRNCIENYVPTTPRTNTLKNNHVDSSLIERVLYINRAAFAPRVLRYYLRNLPSDGDNLRAAAVSLGRLGGLKSGYARAAGMTAEERSEAARKAVLARWAKYRAAKKKAGKAR